jgi:hypothetical protein
MCCIGPRDVIGQGLVLDDTQGLEGVWGVADQSPYPHLQPLLVGLDRDYHWVWAGQGPAQWYRLHLDPVGHRVCIFGVGVTQSSGVRREIEVLHSRWGARMGGVNGVE